MTLTAILVDDHPIFRDGLARLIGGRLDVSVSEVGDMASLRALLDQNGPPDLLVLDVLFPGFDVATDLAQLRDELAVTAIVVVSMVEEKTTIDNILADGVNGFVSKSVSPDCMVSAIGAVLEGNTVEFRPEVSAYESRTDQPVPERINRLPPRQLEVLTLICQGQSNKEIAKVLNLSPFTVRIHVSALLKSLDVSTRTAAAAMASKYIKIS